MTEHNDVSNRVYTGPDGTFFARVQDVPSGWEARDADDEDWELATQTNYDKDVWVQTRPRVEVWCKDQAWYCGGVICESELTCVGHPPPHPGEDALTIILAEVERLEEPKIATWTRDDLGRFRRDGIVHSFTSVLNTLNEYERMNPP